jgi:hypothetical protein
MDRVSEAKLCFKSVFREWIWLTTSSGIAAVLAWGNLLCREIPKAPSWLAWLVFIAGLCWAFYRSWIREHREAEHLLTLIGEAPQISREHRLSVFPTNGVRPLWLNFNQQGAIAVLDLTVQSSILLKPVELVKFDIALSSEDVPLCPDFQDVTMTPLPAFTKVQKRLRIGLDQEQLSHCKREKPITVFGVATFREGAALIPIQFELITTAAISGVISN